MIKLLYQAVEARYFSLLDLHFAKMVANNDAQLMLLSALVSRSYGLGHTLLPFTDYLHQPDRWFADQESQIWPQLAQELCDKAMIKTPDDWQVMISTVQQQSPHPLRITPYGIYLTKNYIAETHLIDYFNQQHKYETIDWDHHQLHTQLNNLFPAIETVDWQKVAAANTLTQQLSIISGGPGTGKTTTVAKILLLLNTLAPKPLSIVLCAPTGKAAARLIESIGQQKIFLQQSHQEYQQAIEQIPTESHTLHRLLGIHPLKQTPKYHAHNRLNLDVLVIDEASMIDMHLFALVINALPKQARLIILGDKDQLSSVEAGAVMAELCDTEQYSPNHIKKLAQLTGYLPETLTPKRRDDNKTVVFNHLSTLKVSHRFSKEAPIGLLASAINDHTPPHEKIHYCKQLVSGAYQPILVYHELANEQTITTLLADIQQRLEPYKSLLATASMAQELFDCFNQMRILCAQRSGPFGTININDLIGQMLFGQQHQNLYHGQVIMIKHNDYEHNLYNGDIGIVLEEASMRFRVYFEMPNQPPRVLSAQLLPQYETAFAITVHKAQGSEFTHVLLVLGHYESPVLTRELFYTGVTRAKTSVKIYASTSAFNKALSTQTKRFSGIAKRLQSLPQ